VQILRAKTDDASTLTEVAFAAKRHWGYPEQWIESWRDLLTIRPEFIASHETHEAIVDNRIVGFYALERKERRMDLLHLWVLPDWMGRGVGRSLFQHALERAKVLGVRELEIESDPNAEGFYKRMGARRIGASIKDLDGQKRELPILIYEMKNE
jgi:N-acetylglutamate synthase-like GNAT family acetyltransferase